MAIEVAFELLGPCNYSCQYCREGKPMPYPEPVLHDLKALQHIYDDLIVGEVTTTLYARGTEPAIHPQMKGIAAIVTPHGKLHISTNLSLPVGSWLPGPHNIELLATIHPEAEADLPGFMARVKDAMEQGYDLKVQALGDDPHEDWRKMLQEAGLVRPFVVYKIRSDSRWKAESAAIVPPPPGSLCKAGYATCFINSTTQLRRCMINNDPLGKLYTKPVPCRAPRADTRCQSRWVKEG